MTVSGEFPQKCQECLKSTISSIHKKCRFCQDIKFEEEILCHLNRCIQKPSEFKCHAFQPALKLVDSLDPKGQKPSVLSRKNLRPESIKKFLQSDKVKYQRALAVQRLIYDPDGVFMNLKYHFSWNAIHRTPLLSSNTDIIDLIYDSFFRCSERIGESVNLLWLAPDHIHIYVETDGERPVEEIVQEIKRVSQEIVFTKYSSTMKELQLDNHIWDEAYFAETLG